MDKLSVIIPTKDRPNQLKQCVEHALKATKHIEAEVIIINDSEKDVKIQKNYKVKLYKNPGKGAASARNFGVKKSQFPMLLLLDDDMLIFKENIDKIIKIHSEFPNIALNLNWVYPPDLQKNIMEHNFGRYLNRFEFNSLKGWNNNMIDWKDDSLFLVSGITSQNLSLRKDDFYEIGGYDENFPHAGFEDLVFSDRLKKAGVKIYIEPRSMTYHNEVDRQELKNWLNRIRRGGITRLIAAHLGYKEVALQYSLAKKLLLNFLLIVRPLLILMIKSVSRLKSFDVFVFKIISYLMAASIFEGYTSKEANQYIVEK